MILTRLRQETSHHHGAMERKLPLMDPGLSREQYVLLLVKFFGYYAPLESRLLLMAGHPELAFDYGDRRKSHLLTEDMVALGQTSEDLAKLPLCEELPELATLAQVFGCLYVIEGATLGGQLITKRLRSILGLTPTSGAAFFNGYGPQTGPRWSTFCSRLTDIGGQPDEDKQIVASANRTFETMDRWLLPKPNLPAEEATHDTSH